MRALLDHYPKLRAHLYPVLTEKVAKLNKRAAKLGVEPIDVELVREWREKERDHFGILRERPFVEVNVYGPEIVGLGWTLRGTVEYMGEAGNIVNGRVERDYQQHDGSCDHCGTKRSRKKTIVCFNPDTGEELAFGTSCVRDYLGVDTRIATWVSDVVGLSGDLDEEAYASGGGKFAIMTREYLGWVAGTVREAGMFVTKRVANESDGSLHATAFAALSFYFDYHYPPKGHDREQRREAAAQRYPTATDWELVEAALAWAAGLTGTSDFDNNLRVVANCPVIGEKHMGTASYIVGGYLRQKARIAEREAEAVAVADKLNEWVGEAGDRLELSVLVTRTYDIDGYYGPSRITTMEDDEGRCYVWFSTGEWLETGDRVLLRGTVKKHNDYKGRKQTVLTRCAVREKEVV